LSSYLICLGLISRASIAPVSFLASQAISSVSLYLAKTKTCVRAYECDVSSSLEMLVFRARKMCALPLTSVIPLLFVLLCVGASSASGDDENDDIMLFGIEKTLR
jgi:hypothetical protein